MNVFRSKFAAVFVTAALSSFCIAAYAGKKPATPVKHNVILFIADGLRHGSVNSIDTPTLNSLRSLGVHFVNSHSIFPTFTTANASVMATGHLLGDTGDFSNTLHPGYAIFNTGNFGKSTGTLTPFVENNQVLADLDDHFSGNYLNEETILGLARKNGYATASIGKVGPASIFDVSQLAPLSGAFQLPTTVIIDDATGSAAGVPLPAAISSALIAASLPTTAPNRQNGAASTSQLSNGFSGNNATPGTLAANVNQQQFFADALTKAVLPTFVANNEPFVAVFWSRDPDGTQHNQGDSLNTLTPGINGPTSKLAIANVDNNLKQILTYLQANPSVAANTDIIVTSDHGFSTISRHETDATGKNFVNDYASTFTYVDATARQEVNTSFLPVGFLAIDIAHALNLPLYDPDNQILAGDNVTKVYEPVDPTIAQQTSTVRQHSGSGNGIIGGTGHIPASGESADAKVIVAANGGSDLIYVPTRDPATVSALIGLLRKQSYTGGLFVDDSYGPIAGALPLSSIGFKGASPLPMPTIVINFKNFALDSANPSQSRVEIADTGLQEGQGMHGSFSRGDTYNNMAAWGPDFKQNYTDIAPVSNADLALSIAAILKLHLPANGHLTGRLLSEAFNGYRDSGYSPIYHVEQSLPGDGVRTYLVRQSFRNITYFDAACVLPADAADHNPHVGDETTYNPCD